MADLTTNLGREYQGPITKSRYDVGANLEVFAGQAICAGTGGVINAAAGGGDFVGFAVEYVNNLTNAVPHGGAARAAKVEIAIAGFVWLTIAKGGAIVFGDIGLPVYATDGNTFDLADAGTDILVGRIKNVDYALGDSTGSCLVQFGYRDS